MPRQKTSTIFRTMQLVTQSCYIERCSLKSLELLGTPKACIATAQPAKANANATER